MKFRSTRQQDEKKTITFSEAVAAGLADDGGLYVPETLPQCADEIKRGESFLGVAEKILSFFLKGDPLEKNVTQLCRKAFTFPAPLKFLDDTAGLLELFHGPTAAFKDFGASFLAQCFENTPTKKMRTILVATSGDTGGAVGAAFSGRPNVEVFILYPKGMISPLQETQLTCWEPNVHALRVRGTFDDCQRLVKRAFSDTASRAEKNLTSANSINVGRILPQMTYFAWASLAYFEKTGRQAGFIVPTGNVGNALAALWAKHTGFPISRVIMACNANRSVVDYFETGTLKSAATIQTLASAMDVGNPSNLERVQKLYPDVSVLKTHAAAFSVSDDQIKKAIQLCEKKWSQVVCPHTATAVHVRENLPNELKKSDWIITATAHPAKFKSVVEPLIHREIPMPASLTRLLKLKSQFIEIEPELTELRANLLS